MAKLPFWAVILYAIFAMLTAVAVGKIIPPKPPAPVIANGVRYSADRDGKDQYVVATIISTGEQSWKVRVCFTRASSYGLRKTYSGFSSPTCG